MNPSSSGRPWLLLGLLTVSLSLNLYMVTNRPGQANGIVVHTDAVPNLDQTHVDPKVGPVSIPVEVVPASDGDRAPNASTQERDLRITDPDWNLMDEEVTHSLARTFSNADSENGNALSAVYSRLFHWDIDLRRDLRKGDRIRVAWKKNDDGIEIAVASLQSGKLGKTLTAYRYHRTGDSFPSYWQKNGVEITRQLKDSPLPDYEMVTSL